MAAKESKINPNFKMEDQRMDAMTHAEKTDIVMVGLGLVHAREYGRDPRGEGLGEFSTGTASCTLPTDPIFFPLDQPER